MKNSKKIFVGGYNGSGTRVPQLILEKAGYFTGDLVAAEIDYLPLASFKAQLLHDNKFAELFSNTMRTKSHREMLDKIFASFIDKESKWSIKHGFLMLSIPILREAYPDCKFILMIRHGVDVVINKHFMEEDIGKFYDFDKGEDILEKRMNFWKFCYEKALKDGEALGDDFHVIKFEDMIENPKEETKKLFDKFGIEETVDTSWLKKPATIGRREQKVLLYPGIMRNDGSGSFPYFPDLDKERLYKIGEPILKKFDYEL